MAVGICSASDDSITCSMRICFTLLIAMHSNQSYIQLLNNDLIIFFKNAVRISLKTPFNAFHFLKITYWQKRAARKRTKNLSKGIHVPPIIIFSITHRCNLHCKGCYAEALNRRSDGELSDAELARIIREAHELGSSFFVLAGGEPLVRKNILDITEVFRDILFLVFTNGLLIDEQMLERLKKQKNIVPVISLEGYESETDIRRGKGVFLQLNKIVRQLQKAGIFFGVSVTVSRLNLPVIFDGSFVNDLVESGCRMFFFLEYTAIREGTE